MALFRALGAGAGAGRGQAAGRSRLDARQFHRDDAGRHRDYPVTHDHHRRGQHFAGRGLRRDIAVADGGEGDDGPVDADGDADFSDATAIADIGLVQAVNPATISAPVQFAGSGVGATGNGTGKTMWQSVDNTGNRSDIIIITVSINGQVAS